MLLVERIQRSVVADVTGGEQQRVDAELVHALDHDLGLTEAVFGIAPDLHRDIRSTERAVPHRLAIGREPVAQVVDQSAADLEVVVAETLAAACGMKIDVAFAALVEKFRAARFVEHDRRRAHRILHHRLEALENVRHICRLSDKRCVRARRFLQIDVHGFQAHTPPSVTGASLGRLTMTVSCD